MDDVQKQLAAENLIFDNDTLNIKPLLSDMATQLKIERLQNQLLQQPQSNTLQAEPPADPGIPLTVPQAAKLLNLHTRTVYDLCATGKLQNQRHGTKRGTIRITRKAIERYLAQFS
jgi:excisionase family DNA binding protein